MKQAPCCHGFGGNSCIPPQVNHDNMVPASPRATSYMQQKFKIVEGNKLIIVKGNKFKIVEGNKLIIVKEN